jgi:hypothetical protein
MGYAAMRHIVRAILFIALIAFFVSSLSFGALFVAAIVEQSLIVALVAMVGCIFSLAAVSWIMENSA